MITTVVIIFFALLIIGVPVAWVVLGAAAVGLLGSGFDATLITQQTVFGVNSYVVLAVPFFIISGDLAAKGQTSSRIVGVINAWLGRVPGGLGVATIFACAFFGAITGSAIATVVAIGSLMLPKLIENGYPRGLAIGIITCGGTLGVMIPPSIPMLLMAVALQAQVGAQFLAGFLPGILTSILMGGYVIFYAKRHGLQRGPKLTFKEKMKITGQSVWALLFPVIVLGSIYGGIATPTEAAVISVFYVAFVEAFIYRELSFKKLWNQLGDSTVSAATMSVYMATAQPFIYYLTTAKVPQLMLDSLTASVSSSFGVLMLLCLMFLIVGCFTNVGTVVVILGSILLPILNYYNINVYHFNIIATLMAQIGFVTPPFGLCLFVSMKMAKADMIEVTKGSMPFLICMAIATLIIILIPQIATFLPHLTGAC